MASGSSQSQSGINVTDSSVGVIQTGGNCNIRDIFINNSSLDEPEIYFDLPRRITTFRGRETEMQTLDSLFFTQNKKTVVICGLGGFGKSELSMQYAEICIETKKIDKVFWINCDNKDYLQRSFQSLKRIYKKFDKNNCLFIFDNSLNRQDIFHYEPPENNKHFLLITSQEKDWGDDVEILKLNPLSLESAVNVFRSVLSTNYKNEDQNLYEELADVVGNIPLGLQITGAYIRQRIKSLGNDFQLNEYIKLLRQSQKEFIDVKIPTSAANDYKKSICGAIKISIDKIRDEEDSEMRDLTLNVLCSCSFLHPYYITYDIFLEMRNIAEIMATILDKSKLKLAINILDNYLFLDYRPDNKQITIHHFTQEILQFYLGKSESKLQMNCFCSYLDFACNKNNAEKYFKFLHLCHIFRFADNNISILSNYCSHNISKNDETFKTIINYCVYFKCQKCLINLCENYDYIEKYVKETILIHHVVQLNLLDFFKLLVQNFNVNSASEGQNTVLHTAASKRNLNAIKILIENKANTSLRNANGNTPLFSFIESYRGGCHINLDEVMEICELLNCDENKNITNYMGQSLLHVAAAAGQEQLIKLLINKYKMNANEKDLQSRTPLHSITLSSASYTIHMKIITEILNIFENIKLENNNFIGNIFENLKLVLQYINILSMNVGEDILLLEEFEHKIINCLINCNKILNNNDDIYQLNEITADLVSKTKITINELHQKINDLIKPYFNDNQINTMKIKKYMKEFGFNINKCINRFVNYNSRYAVPKKNFHSILNQSLEKSVVMATHLLFEHSNLIDIMLESLSKIMIIIIKLCEDEFPLKTIISEIIQDNINNIEEVMAATRELIKQGASPEIKDRDNKTPLDYAINYKLYYLADMFLFSDKIYALQQVTLSNNDLKFYFVDGDISEFYLLHKAIAYNKINVLNERGINVRNKNKRGVTPLHAAAFHWHLEAIIGFIKNGADINIVNYNRETPLFYFIRGVKYQEIIDIEKIKFVFDLLKLEDNQYATNKEGQTLMYVAAAMCNKIEMLNLLVQRGLNVNSKNVNQGTPLHAAASHWNLPAIKFLVKHKANRIATDCLGETALFKFLRNECESTDISVDEINEIFDLLKLEEQRNAINKYGHKLIYIAAAFCHNIELLNLLLIRGLDINSKNNNQATPLHEAASHWNLPAMKFLVKHKADLNAIDCIGETALFKFIRCACEYEDIYVDKINKTFDLLELEANQTITNNDGETLLHLTAALCNNKVFLHLLLQRGFDVNSAAGDLQATALHAAAFQWNLSALKFLIEHNANVNVKNSLGETALFNFIEGACHHKTINLDEVDNVLELLQFNKNKDTTTKNNNTLLHYAACSYHDELVSLLLMKYKMKVNHQNLQRNTPLHIVIITLDSGGFQNQDSVIRTVQVLKEHGARLDIKNEDGKTPLQLAQERGTEFLFTLLTETAPEQLV